MIPIIIQTTYFGSIPGKCLLPFLNGKSVISFLGDRLKSEWDGKVIVATSINSEDDVIVEDCQKNNLECFRGSLTDVTNRIYECCKYIDCQHIIRVYGNSPLLDIDAMRELLDEHINSGADYSYNSHREGVPIGMGCEIIRKDILKHLNFLGRTPEQKRAGFLYLRQSSHNFKIYKQVKSLSHDEYVLNIDFRGDVDFLKDIASNIDHINAENALRYLEKHPGLQSLPEDLPKEVGIDKLLLHPDRIASIVNNPDADLIKDYPISVELSLTNKCNLHCRYCSDAQLRINQTGTDLDKDELNRLFIDLQAGGTKGIVIEGGGEPTQARNFDEIIDNLYSLGMSIGMITNGTRALSPETLSKFDWIRVSVDASTQSEYLDLKGVDMFQTVMDNLAVYKSYCPVVGIGYVVTNKNLGDIENFILRVRQSKISYIQFRPVIDSPELAPDVSDLLFLKRFERDNFIVMTDGMKENVETGNAGLPCVAHGLTTVITANGDVFICGRLNIYPWLKPIGNIKENSFSDIWLGEERRKQSAMIADKGFCLQNCPQCRMLKFNKLFSRLAGIKTRNFI